MIKKKRRKNKAQSQQKGGYHKDQRGNKKSRDEKTIEKIMKTNSWFLKGKTKLRNL